MLSIGFSQFNILFTIVPGHTEWHPGTFIFYFGAFIFSKTAFHLASVSSSGITGLNPARR